MRSPDRGIRLERNACQFLTEHNTSTLRVSRSSVKLRRFNVLERRVPLLAAKAQAEIPDHEPNN